jgi:hypothetical protein
MTAVGGRRQGELISQTVARRATPGLNASRASMRLCLLDLVVQSRAQSSSVPTRHQPCLNGHDAGESDAPGGRQTEVHRSRRGTRTSSSRKAADSCYSARTSLTSLAVEDAQC